jgi:hypothetical protein
MAGNHGKIKSIFFKSQLENGNYILLKVILKTTRIVKYH